MPRNLRYNSVALAADTTLDSRDIKVEGLFVAKTGVSTLTVPTPDYDFFVDGVKFAILNDTAGAITAACTNGFAQAGDSISIASAETVEFECVDDGTGAYIWMVSTGGTAITPTTEQVQDIVGAFVNANLLGLTGAYDDAGNAMSLTNDVAAYVFTSLTGGTAVDLDSVDGDDLSDGDRALVVVGNAPGSVTYFVLDADDGGAENGTTRIAPDTNPGTKMWIAAPLSAGMQTYGNTAALAAALNAFVALGTQTDCTLAINAVTGAIDLDVNIPGQLTTDQEAAIDGAATPSAANVFMTTSAVAATFGANPLGTAVAALAAKATPIDADSILLVDSADTNDAKETTIAELKAVVLSADNVGSAIAGYAAKASPIDADSIALCDSADTNDAKETTIAELRAALLAADPLGSAIAGLDAKASPIAADSIILCDSADTNNAKEVTITQLASALSIPVKATGAEINTGTDDDKFVTAKAITDSELVALLNSVNWADYVPVFASVPAVDSMVARIRKVGNSAEFYIDVRGSDGDGWTPSTVSFGGGPAPLDVNAQVPIEAWQVVAGVVTNMMGRVDAETDFRIEFDNAVACTDTEAWSIRIKGSMEVSA